MKLSRRAALVGGVLGLLAPRPPPLSEKELLALRVKAELAKLRVCVAALVAKFNEHTHNVSPGPTAPPQPLGV